jgi:hypothetical protein
MLRAVCCSVLCVCVLGGGGSFIQRVNKEDMKARYPALALRLKRCTRVEEKVNKKGKSFKEAMVSSHCRSLATH